MVQKAVEEDFRIARLYEYYMIAMDETRMQRTASTENLFVFYAW